MPAITNRDERDGVNVVWDEGAVRTGSVAETLREHAAEHSLQAVAVRVGVAEHALEGGTHTHLAGSNLHRRVKEVEVGELAICAVVENMQFIVSMAPWSSGIVDCYGTLKCTALDR